MALKKPLVTSNFGGLKEVNINNKSGYVINVNNINLLSNKIINLLNNKNKRNSLGYMGHKIFKSKFTANIMSNNYYNFVKKEISK